MKKHQSHNNLINHSIGNDTPLEITLLGTACNIVESLMFKTPEKLFPTLSVVYLYSSHKEDLEPDFSFTYNKHSFSSSRKVFINSDIETIRLEQKLITDVNNKETFEKVKQQIL